MPGMMDQGVLLGLIWLFPFPREAKGLRFFPIMFEQTFRHIDNVLRREAALRVAL